jgi:hypothetical protein
VGEDRSAAATARSSMYGDGVPNPVSVKDATMQ